jgi:hypothetical protein
MVAFNPVTESDLPQIGDWIDAEPSHAGKFTPEFFFRGGKACIFCTKVEDASGPVMYLRINREIRDGILHEGVVRILPQFAPSAVVSRLRVARVLGEGFPLLAAGLKKTNNIHGFIFDSVSVPAIQFMSRHFGFAQSDGDKYSLVLETPAPTSVQLN